MEFIGRTVLKGGKETEEFVLCCPDHGYYFNGRPPLTTGCRECWASFYVGSWALAGAKPEHVDQLESAIHHAAELEDKGEFDFKPKLEDLKIEREN